jgi:cellulose synthase/poly-beta-1,6-N-acetylglucosamine synthase-like glycosyltransferase
VIFWIFIAFTGLIYIFLVSFIISGWVRTETFIMKEGIDQPTVTVIIAVRNEITGLNLLLSDLADQKYPKDKFEVIIVDDHSVNAYYGLISSFVGKINIRSLSLDHDEEGKKAALIKGINSSSSELVLTTDADCRVTPFWISEMSNYYISGSVKLVFGSVLYRKSRKINEWMQGLEYLGLITAGAGFAGNGHPIICSAANMGFERTRYIEFVRENPANVPVSGDDVMFMLWLKKKFPGKTGFIKSLNSVVVTNPATGLKEFINQRLRWTSKSRYYRDSAIILTALAVYFESIVLLGLFVGAIFSGLLLKGFLILFLSKCIADLAVFYTVTRYYNNRYLLIVFIPVEIIYFIYISIIGLAGNLVSFKWKGRRSEP